MTPASRRRTALGAIILFGAMWALVAAGWTDRWDHAALAALRLPGEPGAADLPSWLIGVARAVTSLGGGDVRAPLACGAALLLAARGWPRPAAAIMLGWGGETLLVEALKALARRARPDALWRLEQAGGYSFPSGHAAGAMLLYPLLGWFVAGSFGGSAAARWGALIGIAAAIFVGLTRVILGVHWGSDVLGGWLLGGAIALFAATARPAAG